MTDGENDRVLSRLRATMADYLAGEADADVMQAALQQAMSLLERDTGLERLIRIAEADIEEITFLVVESEQRDRVRIVIEELAAALPS